MKLDSLGLIHAWNFCKRVTTGLYVPADFVVVAIYLPFCCPLSSFIFVYYIPSTSLTILKSPLPETSSFPVLLLSSVFWCVLFCSLPLNFIDLKSPLERFPFPSANLQQIYLYLGQISVRCECMTSTCVANLQHDKEENLKKWAIWIIFLFDSSNIFLDVADPLFMPSVWNQLHSCWTASPAGAADGGNLSTCEEHEDTRLLSRTANHLSTCEEHEHTLSKTANNCSVKIKWKCYKFAGRCNDLNSWRLAVGAADSVPTPGDWIFFLWFSWVLNQFLAIQSCTEIEREFYQSTILGICPLECIGIQPDQGAYLRVSDQILAARHPTEAFIFMYDVFCTRRKDKDFLFQSWASSSSAIRAEREKILQGNSHVCTTERNTLTRLSIFSWQKGCEEKRSLLCSTWSDQAGAPPGISSLVQFLMYPINFVVARSSTWWLVSWSE